VPIFTWTVACAGSTQNPEAKSVERQRLGLKANGQDKFMQSLGSHVYMELSRLAKEKGVSVQELIRALIIPDWIRTQDNSEKGSRKRTS